MIASPAVGRPRACAAAGAATESARGTAGHAILAGCCLLGALAGSIGRAQEPPTIEVAMSYPERRGDRTVVVGELRLPAAVGEVEVVGEVMAGETLRESFRSRLAAQPAGDERRASFVRLLAPGPYELRLLVTPAGGGEPARLRSPLDVPLLPPSAEASGGVVVRLSAPEGLVTGALAVEARVEGEGVAELRFELDGREVLARRRPPWRADLDLGETPRPHRVGVVALDEAGRTLASDEVIVNGGPHRFAVRLLAPSRGGGGGAWVEAAVTVPEGESLATVELLRDETRLAVLAEPPFLQPLPAVPAEPGSHVRAVATLESGARAEDLVFLSAPPNLDELEVRIVRLTATVTDRRGRPVEDLGADDFRLAEDGRPQRLLRVERVEEQPLHVGILLDTSASMSEEIDDAETTALGFFEQILGPRDRACVVTFADAPRLVVPFTASRERLAGGLAGLVADGETALWDSLVFTLHYFSGIPGRKALVLLSDGEDVDSRWRYEDVLELARRTEVAVYVVGLRLGGSDPRPRMLLAALARETGGTAHFVRGVGDVAALYSRIEEELRGQYLLVYQSDGGAGDGGYREIALEVGRPGAQVRAQRGYYP